MATEQQIADWRARKELGGKSPRLHFEVIGPGRDYDFSTFCAECYPDALECAKDWIEESVDATDADDEVCIIVKVIEGDPEECYGDVCIHMRKDDDDGN